MCDAEIVLTAHAILCPMMSSAVGGTKFLGLDASTEFFSPIGRGSHARFLREIPSPTKSTRAWSHLRYQGCWFSLRPGSLRTDPKRIHCHRQRQHPHRRANRDCRRLEQLRRDRQGRRDWYVMNPFVFLTCQRGSLTPHPDMLFIG